MHSVIAGAWRMVGRGKPWKVLEKVALPYRKDRGQGSRVQRTNREEGTVHAGRESQEARLEI